MLMNVRMMCATPMPCVPTLKDPMFAPVTWDIQEMERLVQVKYYLMVNTVYCSLLRVSSL